MNVFSALENVSRIKETNSLRQFNLTVETNKLILQRQIFESEPTFIVFSNIKMLLFHIFVEMN